MLSYGAAITSMGLALATWVPRLGRAIAINVVIFVLITIGWPLLLRILHLASASGMAGDAMEHDGRGH